MELAEVLEGERGTVVAYVDPRDGRRLLISELTAKQGRKENRAISRAERLAERYRNENRLGHVRIVKLDRG